MHREGTSWAPDRRLLFGLVLTSLAMFGMLGLAAGDRASDALMLGIRMYALASDVMVRWVTHHLDQVLLTIGASWALMAGFGIWILWRVSLSTVPTRDPHEVSHGS